MEFLENKMDVCKAYFVSLQMNICFGMVVFGVLHVTYVEEGSSSNKKELEIVIGGFPLESKRRKTSVKGKEIITIL